MLSQFAHELRCLYCGKPNPATEWRAAGDLVPFYFQREPGKHNLTMTCPHCGRAWYVVWDDNPGPLQNLLLPSGSGPTADVSATDPDMEGFVRELLSDASEVRDRAIERARELAQKANRTGLAALAEAIRRRSGSPRCEFYTPGVRVSGFAQLSAARDELQSLASKRQLLNNPEHTQSLLAQIPSGDFHELWAEVGRLGGDQEWRAFQLLGTHLVVHAELLKSHREKGDRAPQRPSVDPKPVREAQPTAVVSGWYCKTSEAELGPMAPSALRKLAAKGALQPENLVRKGADGKWVKAGLVKGLFPDVTTRSAKSGASGNPPSARKNHGATTVVSAQSRETTTSGWFQKV